MATILFWQKSGFNRIAQKKSCGPLWPRHGRVQSAGIPTQIARARSSQSIRWPGELLAPAARVSLGNAQHQDFLTNDTDTSGSNL
jgi:hypothetical protein